MYSFGKQPKYATLHECESEKGKCSIAAIVLTKREKVEAVYATRC